MALSLNKTKYGHTSQRQTLLSYYVKYHFVWSIPYSIYIFVAMETGYILSTLILIGKGLASILS